MRAQAGRVDRRMRAVLGRAATVGLATVLVVADPAAAAAGSLDRSFNGTGMVLVRRGESRTAALQAQWVNTGKIVVGTAAGLVRFTARGAIDTSFGRAGLARSPGVADIAVQGKDDSLVTVHGGATPGLVVSRFTSAGKPDTTFDRDGSAEVPVAGFPTGAATAVAVSPDSRIVVAGYAVKRLQPCVPVVLANLCAAPTNVVVARLLPNGAVDTSFGVNGTTLLTGFAAFATPVDVAVGSDGAISLIGNTRGAATPNGTDTTTVVSRLRPDGHPDVTYGTAGQTTFGPSRASAAQLDVHGRLVVAGSDEGVASSMNVTRLLPTGAVDTPFGVRGTARWAPATCLRPWCNGAGSIAVVPPTHPGGGRLVVAGWHLIDDRQHLAVAAFEYESGMLDRRFGNQGSVVPGPQISQAHTAAVTPDGKLLVAGRRYIDDILLYRFHLR